MRRLFVSLAALLALGLRGPVLVAAQDATPAAQPATDPEAGAPRADLSRTDVRYFLPYGADGLNPGLTVTANASGVCGFESLATPGRHDAWDCIGADNQVYDPCFENPFAALDEPGELACVASPFATDVVLFRLTEPLVRQKEGGPDDAGGAAPPPDDALDQPPADQAEGTADGIVDPLDLPWALELANGERCSLLTGASAVLAGQRVHYECDGGGSVIGEIDRGQQVWMVSYLADGAIATTLIDVAVAWV